MSTSMYKINTNECRFYPVQCTNETFQKLKAQDGYVYFVTDKKKLYLGKNGNMIPMCANSGIFYGNKPIEYDNSGIKPNPAVTFMLNEIEGEDIPEVDDLILNIGTIDYPDGCFYRVGNIVDDVLETTRLTLQGTGGGSGSGSTTPGGSFSIAMIDGVSKVFSSTAQNMNITFKGYYNGVEENRISQVTFTKKGDTEPFYTYTKELAFNENQTIDLYSYMNLFSSVATTVTIAVKDLYGNERSTYFTIQIVELSLVPLANATTLISSYGTSERYTCQLVGGLSGVTNKKITYTLYDEKNLNVPVSTQYRELLVTDEGSITKELSLGELPHGVYVMKVVASANIGTSTDILYSNELTLKLVRFDTNNNKPLLAIFVPEKTEQYTNIPINYLLVTSDISKEYLLDIKIDGTTKTTQQIYSNVIGEYSLYFENEGTYTLLCNIPDLGLSYTEYLKIEKYTGNLPVIDPTRDELMLYLNPRGKSNNAIDKNEWKDYNGRYTAQLNNFHYGLANGWMIDDIGTSYLLLSSGASLTIPEFYPFAEDPSKTQGMTIELDFELSGVLDFDTELIKCISLNRDNAINTGFSITGDKIRFYNSRLNGGEKGALMNLNLVENKRVRITIVIEPNNGSISFPMCYIYLDGKLSGAVIYDKNDAYQDTIEGTPARFQINSANAQIKLYGVRFYSAALSNKIILDNYTASLPTLKERQEKFDSNNVLNAFGDVDYIYVSAENYNLQIPYMKITGGWATEKESKWQLKSKTNANVGLPTGKKDYRLIDVEVVYPDNDYFKNYNNYKFVNEFASGNSMATAYGEKPSNGGAIMYSQGTSSMEYPTKNLRLRFKNKEDWYTVRPDITDVEIICMKADYMESSGSHNTGAANLIDDLYTGIQIETPGQEHFGGEGKDTIVTCIKGHPCLIFYSESGQAGTYKYIGKYNLNLDKATPEPFGFNHDDSDFGYLDIGDTYYEIKYDEEGDYVQGQIEVEKTVKEGERINSIHCFEFLDNAVKVCNFLVTENKDVDGNVIENYHDTWYNTFWDAKEKRNAPGWTLGFESRYPEDRIGYHDADSLYPLASWLNELYLLRQTDENYALARFANEYQCYLDKDFLLTYYLVTEVLLMADSRVKNMMIATWGREKREYRPLKKNGDKWVVDNSEEATVIETNNYIFYPIFYDMDTMLGLDNTGVSRFNYYDEDTDPAIYNGDEVLWNFVRDALPLDLIAQFSKLEGSLLTFGKDENGRELGVLPYFNENQANMANEAFYNSDAKYKYINPARNGYYDYLNGQNIAPGAGPFLYAAQGDRSLMREYIIYNRLRFLRGKYASTLYQSGDRIDFRWYYPTGTSDDEKLNLSSQAVKPDGLFNFTSLKTGYAGVKLGANGNVYNERFEGEESKTIDLVEASSANGTEAYLLGLSTLTDLGDLSNKYMQKFIISSNDVRLKRLTLGNPHKDYYNPYWAPGENQAGLISLQGCTYLEYFNLQNCSRYNNVLDFSPCPSIKQILLTGSNVSALTLPTNGFIEELRLPADIKELRIEGHTSLTDEGFSMGSYNYGTGTKIGEKNEDGTYKGYYVNDFSKLEKIYISGAQINSYDMLRQTKALTQYYFDNINWVIDENDVQYCARKANEVDLENKEYYKYNPDNGSYSLYEEDVYPDTGMLYEKIDMIIDNEVVAIPILDYLLTKSTYDNKMHGESLSGTITIALSSDYSVNELEIYEKYHNLYPDLNILYSGGIEVEGAHRIYFYPSDLNGVSPYFIGVTSGKKYSLNDLISVPTFSDPIKPSTTTEIYTFTGIWIDSLTNLKYCQDSYSSKLDNDDYDYLFSEVKPDSDMRLIPQFDEETRIYKVNFYDYDYTLGDEPLFSLNGEYENIIADINNNPLAYYVYRPDDDLTGSLRYAFKGWQNESNFNNNVSNPPLVNLSETKIYSDLNFFAYYEIEDANLVASDSVLFNFNNNSISIKNEYRNIAGGKITLPSKNTSENNILKLADFESMQNVKEFYFLSNATYSIIEDSCFYNNRMVAIYLPDSITSIGRRSFYDAIELEIINLGPNITAIGEEAFSTEYKSMKVKVADLPENLVELGERAFHRGGKNITISKIPDKLNYIPVQCFMACPNVTICDFPERDTDCEIGSQAFWGCGNNSLINKITISTPWRLGKPVLDNLSRVFYTGYPNVTLVEVSSKNIVGKYDNLELELFGELREKLEVQEII